MGFRDEIGLVVRIGPVVGIGLFGGTGLVMSLTKTISTNIIYFQLQNSPYITCFVMKLNIFTAAAAGGATKKKKSSAFQTISATHRVSR